ncbi:Myb-like_DNA-binding domain-containing protein [Hexamita inflata]|uniref:Myb-like DNA-binding domain-containing protein n=1 Tax=Hexamita inflata TaxID=28002 RepID=A0AA86Q266_9EUKA|nr:Myb-like DNA-binding domain-containing protein [Hexamita inflata]
MNRRSSYTPWSDEDIRLLLNVTEQYLFQKIDWVKVGSHFPERTALQCKSFFNNKVKKYVFTVKNGVPQPNFELIQYCYVYYITRFKPTPESLDQKCKRIMAEACWEDIFPTMTLVMKNELNYKYNKKLLVGTREFISYHILQTENFDKLFQTTEKVIIQEIEVNKKQWETFRMYINEMKPQTFLKRIDDFLEQIL